MFFDIFSLEVLSQCERTLSRFSAPDCIFYVVVPFDENFLIRIVFKKLGFSLSFTGFDIALFNISLEVLGQF